MIHFKPYPSEVLDVLENTKNLQDWMNRQRNGTNDTPRSWIYENIKDPNKAIDPIVRKLRSMEDLKLISDWDLGKLSKFGPQGGYAPLDDRLETLNEYFSHLDSPRGISSQEWKVAKRIAIKRLRFDESHSPISAEAVVERGLGEDKYNTSSGYPLYMKRKKPEAIEHSLRVGMNAVKERYPFTLSSRATMGKTGKDARWIFAAPMAVNIQGQRYQQPLQDHLRNLDESFFLPWEGWESVQSEISNSWSKGLKFGADYTKMDQHFNRFHAEEVFDVIKHYFKSDYWDELHELVIYPFTAPVITSNGMLIGPHSLLSGSEWTNFLETVWNYIFTIYLEILYHLKFESKMGIGDDQLWILAMSDSAKSVEWIRKAVTGRFDLFGLPGNPEKQEIAGDHTSFLQRFLCSDWNGNAGIETRAAGVYSLIRNATSEMFPEKYHNEEEWTKRTFALRSIEIAENAFEHPLAEWYVKDWLAKSNANILEFARESDDAIRAEREKARSIANFLPTYNQEKQNTDICSFQTLKWLREVA